MIKDSFYLTLLSNSSMEYFPENKTTMFSTKIPKSLVLEGEWFVGVVEIQYPCTIFTVQENENIIKTSKWVLMPDDEKHSLVHYRGRIPAMNYDSIQHVIAALNRNTFDDIIFNYDEITKQVSISILDNYIDTLTLSTKLCLQLGFEPNKNLVVNKMGTYPSNLKLGLPSQLFVYCDIIEPQIVGDVMAPLLRIVPLDTAAYVYGANKMHIFSPPHYVPVMRREFDTIEIDIRSSTGNKIPFQFGTTCIKLHFRKL